MSKISQALQLLEQSEKPFYEGMKLLKEAALEYEQLEAEFQLRVDYAQQYRDLLVENRRIQNEGVHLSKQDFELLCKSLADAPAPNENLKNLFERFKDGKG